MREVEDEQYHNKQHAGYDEKTENNKEGGEI
jgi:hypothetical protein